MVVQTLFGKTALIRRWGRMDTDRSQTLTTEFDGGDEALAAMDRVVGQCMKRGYQLLPTEENRHAGRVLRAGRANGASAVSSSPMPRPAQVDGGPETMYEKAGRLVDVVASGR